MKRRTKIQKGHGIPEDIITFKILPKLPVKSLLRFMCVSKSWNSLIRSPDFIAAHDHYNQINKNNSQYVLYMGLNFWPSEQACSTLREKDDSPQPSYVKYRDVVIPFGSIGIIGVCEGLICFQTALLHLRGGDICIWNPIVGGVRTVPLPPSEVMDQGAYISECRFSFARLGNDYKVIKLLFRERTVLSGVEMYSLASNSWSVITECNLKLEVILNSDKSPGVFFQGSMYWLEKSHTSLPPYIRTLILRFDMEEGIFEEMEAPPLKSTNYTWKIAVMNGFLVCLPGESYRPLSYVPVWRWVNYNNESSSWILEEFPLPKECNDLKFVEFMIGSGHLVFETRQSGRRIKNKKQQYFAYDFYHNANIISNNNNNNRVGELRELDNIDWGCRNSQLVRARETLFLLNEQHHKNGMLQNKAPNSHAGIKNRRPKRKSQRPIWAQDYLT